MDPIHILLASAREGDFRDLRSLLAATPWNLIPAPTLPHAIPCLGQLATPIVLCDDGFDDLPWRVLLRALIRARRRTRVVLLTDAGGPQLWSQFTARGGFDLLSRPFSEDELIPTLISAYAQYPPRKMTSLPSTLARNAAMERSASR
jgi:DNA-binding NarL/FixJ family response regulator